MVENEIFETFLRSGPYEPACAEYQDKRKKRMNNLTYLLVWLLAILVINTSFEGSNSMFKKADIF